MPDPPIVVVSRHWRDERSELAFVTRSLAGAATRAGPVTVAAPGPSDRWEADGAFDVRGMGENDVVHWPHDLAAGSVVIADELTPDIQTLGSHGLFVSGAPSGDGDGRWQRIRLVQGDGDVPVGLFVPINPLAIEHRHHGFGFTGYLLVLSDGLRHDDGLPDAAAWLTSAFHDLYIVVVEDAVASAWKGRALRGTTRIDTRMDLWRLMAHAMACVDLAPGPLIARECVEALRLGTPIIVPEGVSVAALHAHASSGSTFEDAWGLLEATEKVRAEANRASAESPGRDYADGWFGEPATFVDRLTHRLRQAVR
jgi:hypothetical protein